MKLIFKLVLILTINFLNIYPVMADELHRAAFTGDIIKIKKLLSIGENIDRLGIPNMRNEEYPATPLHWAVLAAEEETVVFLIKKGANVNIAGEDCCGEKITPLETAVSRKDWQLVNILLKAGANVEGIIDYCENWPLKQAILVEDIEIAQLLLEHGANINRKCDNGYTILHYAVMSRKLKAVEYLLSKGMDANAATSPLEGERTPLHMAARKGDIETAKLLIEYGANVNTLSGGNSPLHHAIEQIKGGYDPANHEPIIRLLLSKGADINLRDINGNTPLHTAVERNSEKYVSLLLENNARIDIKNNLGKTPLMLAKEMGNQDIIDLLKKHKPSKGQQKGRPESAD